MVKECQLDPTKSRKGKGKVVVATIETLAQKGRGQAAPETPSRITNCYTTAKVAENGPPNPKIFQVSKVLIDGGSVLNMIVVESAREHLEIGFWIMRGLGFP